MNAAELACWNDIFWHASDRLWLRLRHKPTDRELARSLGMLVSRVREIRRQIAQPEAVVAVRALPGGARMTVFRPGA